MSSRGFAHCPSARHASPWGPSTQAVERRRAVAPVGARHRGAAGVGAADRGLAVVPAAGARCGAKDVLAQRVPRVAVVRPVHEEVEVDGLVLGVAHLHAQPGAGGVHHPLTPQLAVVEGGDREGHPVVPREPRGEHRVGRVGALEVEARAAREAITRTALHRPRPAPRHARIEQRAAQGVRAQGERVGGARIARRRALDLAVGLRGAPVAEVVGAVADVGPRGDPAEARAPRPAPEAHLRAVAADPHVAPPGRPCEARLHAARDAGAALVHLPVAVVVGPVAAALGLPTAVAHGHTRVGDIGAIPRGRRVGHVGGRRVDHVGARHVPPRVGHLQARAGAAAEEHQGGERAAQHRGDDTTTRRQRAEGHASSGYSQMSPQSDAPPSRVNTEPVM
jgi:hypothetical protein